MLAQKRIVRDFKKLRVCKRAEKFISEIDDYEGSKPENHFRTAYSDRNEQSPGGRKEEAITVHENVLC